MIESHGVVSDRDIYSRFWLFFPLFFSSLALKDRVIWGESGTVFFFFSFFSLLSCVVFLKVESTSVG